MIIGSHFLSEFGEKNILQLVQPRISKGRLTSNENGSLAAEIGISLD